MAYLVAIVVILAFAVPFLTVIARANHHETQHHH